MGATIIEKPKVEIDPDLLNQIKTSFDYEGQVILHFLYANLSLAYGMIRIWPSSYLFDLHSNHRSDLVHVENISLFPKWQEVNPFTATHFTLIFSRLPKSCTVFDFLEECGGQGGGFEVRNIQRNETDVYYLRLL